MPRNLAVLRSEVELALAGRVSAPFTYRERKVVETVSIGIPEIDALAGGLPRGGLTEICGPPCSGRTSLLLSALAARTKHAEACALIDGRDAFDPHSAESAGVELKQLLWVRCRNIEQAFRAADLLLQGGGFGFIALDLTDVPRETVRQVPLNTWFRFRRAVEDTPAILAVLEQESNARTCASLVLQLEARKACWVAMNESQDAESSRHSFASLLGGFGVRAKLLRSRIQMPQAVHLHQGFCLQRNGGAAGMFQTKTTWSYSNAVPVKIKSTE
ncbi:MAG: hypothetical protein ACRD4S_13670 [Candidatus Acidiferrales bacterium]